MLHPHIIETDCPSLTAIDDTIDRVRIHGSARMRRALAFALSLGWLASAGAAALPDEDFDVAVVGGGTAGVAAALQSALVGARTVLVEQGFQVGGTMTSGGVSFPGLFHAWGRQVIDGVGYRLVTNCVALAGGTLPDFREPTGAAHWKHQIQINVPLYVALAEEALVTAGVRVHYHSAPTAAVFADGVWRLSVAAVGDTRTIRARQVVDCTGDASVVALAGFARERPEVRQPGTFVYALDPGVDVSKLDGAALERAFAEAVADGRLRPNDARWGLRRFLECRGDTANYIDDADSSTVDLRTDTNMRGRASMLRMYRFVRGLPGLGNASLASMSPEVGVRETYRIRGEYEVTQADYVSGRVFPDSLCYAFYPVDLHDKEKGVAPAHLAEGVVATVPLRALAPKGSRNLLAAGRCVSSDRGANSGLRVEAACMAMGQAAGAAAAVAARRGCSPLEAPLSEVKAALRAHGAIVPAVTRQSDCETSD